MAEDILKKMESGELNSSDWETYLKDAHKKAPGMTPNAFRDLKSDSNMNSYQHLVELAAPQSGQVIVDLACGDGHLFSYFKEELDSNFSYIGIDMSSSELDLARKNLEGMSNFKLLKERAQAISLEDGTCDLVVSHMAFMLMNPIDDVVVELHRILKPNGKFCAVVGSRKVAEGLLKEIHKILSSHLDENISNLGKIPMGDSRTTYIDGLEELFKEDGWKNLYSKDFVLNVACPPNDIWNVFKDMYFVDLLNVEQKGSLRRKIVDFATENSKDGIVRAEFPMLMFRVERA